MRDQQIVQPMGEAPISFSERLLSSESFLALFRDGMKLVEDTAAYLDGNGRAQARQLDRVAALSYASESMRLTTRLMQMTSWLLLQRAVREGELTRTEAAEEHRKVKLRREEMEARLENRAVLPNDLVDLIDRADRLYARILRLDAMAVETPASSNAVAGHLGALEAAFGR
jgi:regulator of CtrA degradation